MKHQHLQVEIKRVSIASVITHKQFIRGMNDYHAGKPFDSMIKNGNEAWNYERVRLFAAAIGRPVAVKTKQGRVNQIAAKWFLEMTNSGAMI